jgi:hypothetical protein
MDAKNHHESRHLKHQEQGYVRAASLGFQIFSELINHGQKTIRRICRRSASASGAAPPLTKSPFTPGAIAAAFAKGSAPWAYLSRA